MSLRKKDVIKERPSTEPWETPVAKINEPYSSRFASGGGMQLSLDFVFTMLIVYKNIKKEKH